MLIGELAQKSGLSRDTIRFYEKEGLIRLGRKQRRENNYKEYDEAALERLQLIKRIKNFGFTLQETAELLSLIAINAATCAEMRGRAVQKIAAIDGKIADLLLLRELVAGNLQACLENCGALHEEDNCPMIMEVS